MRIIDKNTDFYDYLQGIYRDDSVVFDRTDSFMLTKDIMCEHLNLLYYRRKRSHSFVLLQICHSFWLFLLEITQKTDYDHPTDYTVNLITRWDNYNKPRCLIKMDVISLGLSLYRKDWYKWFENDRWALVDHIDDLIHAIDQNDYHVDVSINKHTYYSGDGTKKEKTYSAIKSKRSY